MRLIFEESVKGRYNDLLPECDVPVIEFPTQMQRQSPPRLPEISEGDLSRHYAALARRCHGVCSGFYPLGSCTMKYNPKLDEHAAALQSFSLIHPLQPDYSVQGCLEVLSVTERFLCEITGMDNMTFQPAAGAHGEFTGLLLIKAYHQSRGDYKRKKIIVPDAAHGTNPATATMAGYETVTIESDENGMVDIEKLKAAVSDETAGLMLTNPNTVGLFDRNILEITRIVHEAGGLVYYDGANLNAIMGVARPGDMGFDVIHLNIHKTFAAPHGGGGPGSGPVGCKEFLAKFLPSSALGGDTKRPQSIGQVKAFYGNFAVVVKALTYMFSLGAEGIREAAENAVLNANYMRVLLKSHYDMAYDRMPSQPDSALIGAEPDVKTPFDTPPFSAGEKSFCMHEFVMTLENMKRDTGISAIDVAKAMIDEGIHPPTMYFPLIVKEALMVEPTETESKQTLDEAVKILIKIAEKVKSDPEAIHSAPHSAPIGRPDETKAARNPVLRYEF